MDSKLMGVACCLLVISLSLSVQGQVTRLVTIVEANATDEVIVFYFIDPPPSANDITYTVYYGLNVANPDEFDNTTQGAMMIPGPTTPQTPARITGLPSATTVTVVVVASSATSINGLESSPQSDITFGSDVSAPSMVEAQRLNDNKAIRVTWMAATGNKILNYQVEYRTIDQDAGTILTVTDLGDLSRVIDGVSELSNYEVRVRANVEAPSGDTVSIAVMPGPWSDWVESRVNDCCAVRGGAITLHNGVLLTVFTSLLSIVVLCF